ncbi:DUF1857-domain-containing protein [Meredithblackwellia eburnea MCA 4105]
MKPSFAVSRPVNPPDASPVLTEEQVWIGLGYKVRQPQLFIPGIKSCHVTNEEGSKVTRVVGFGEVLITERIESHEPAIIYFDPEDRGRITNILSVDSSDNLWLTFSFASGLPPYCYKPDGEPIDRSELNKVLGGGIDNTIKVIRELVEGGTIP